MKFKEMAEMSTEELQTRKRDMRQESLHLRLQQQSGQLEQPSRLRLLRRDVARVETVLAQRMAKANAPKAEKKERFMADETNESSASARGTRKTRTGEVISSGMNKTIVVRTI